MRLAALALLLAGAAAAAERHKLDVDPETADGILLQHIQQEPVAARKLALLEKYVRDYPGASSVAWVYEQLIPVYRESQANEKALDAARKLLTLDPADIDTASAALNAAEALAEPPNASPQVTAAALAAWDAGQKTLDAPAPKDADALEDWKRQTQLARQVMTYCEYVLATRAKAADAPVRAQLLEALEQRNPKSKYLESAKTEAVRAYQQFANSEKGVALAEKSLAADPENEDLLMAVAQFHMQRENELPKVLSYSLRVIDLMQRKALPKDVPPEAWAAKKAEYIGFANWMAGVVYAKDGRYVPSERYLRASLPYAQQRPGMLAAAYFYLGFDNYALGCELRDKVHIQEAVKYNKLCASIDTPFRSLAEKNLGQIRNEFNVP